MNILRTTYSEQLEDEQQSEREYRSALRIAHEATRQLREENDDLLDRLTASHRREWCLLAALIIAGAVFVVMH